MKQTKQNIEILKVISVNAKGFSFVSLQLQANMYEIVLETITR